MREHEFCHINQNYILKCVWNEIKKKKKWIFPYILNKSFTVYTCKDVQVLGWGFESAVFISETPLAENHINDTN